mmetsp:Transcript_23777/g.33272  ORF Transcript_23777/g.33272 Transcript_23777/m.33272 type:complete len:218 (+) Transcript_23777:38-691(+)
MRVHSLASKPTLLLLGACATVALILSVSTSRSEEKYDYLASPLAATRSRAVVPNFQGPAVMRISRSMAANAAVDAPTRREAIAAAKGGRKRANAKCAVFPGSGKIVINDKEATEYFKQNIVAYMELYQLLYLLGQHSDYDFHFKVVGGGVTGQKDAIKLAAARLLLKDDFPLNTELPKDQLKSFMKDQGWLTRDARIKERKKYGLKKARKAPQFSKR